MFIHEFLLIPPETSIKSQYGNNYIIFNYEKCHLSCVTQLLSIFYDFNFRQKQK